MLPRFLVPDLDPNRPSAVLPAEEAHHLARVLRLKAGDDVCVFDGRGREFLARVATIAREGVVVTLLEPSDTTRAASVALTLVQAVLKGEAMDDVVRDGTMIGVATIQPVVSDRTTVKASVLPKAVERWRRIALASAKQCGRATLPRIMEPVAFASWIDADIRGDAFLLVEPSVATSSTVTVRALAHGPAPKSASLVVGPEGGWTQEEVSLALAAGCTSLSLGRLT
ncbi:MAG: RsmE family RNA methyltransferase, partial [Vicinamibacterales bacterium]